MAHRIFIDGQAGTTGLDIHARLSGRTEFELVEIDPDRRKDASARRELLNAADVVILCLPDEAAREAVALIDNARVRVLDASSAHRVAEGWTYGMPELTTGHRAAIAGAHRVSNPGCYPTGVLLSLRPLIDAGVLPADADVRINAISGYSGGGRTMVERYAASGFEDGLLLAPRPYGLALAHKHLPEMCAHSGLARTPLFAPSVGPFYKGMLVHLPFPTRAFRGIKGPEDLARLLAERYADEPAVHVAMPTGDTMLGADGQLDPMACNDTHRVDLMVFGNDEFVQVTARLDNLGKGAGGAAVQNLNLMLGLPEFEGLNT